MTTRRKDYPQGRFTLVYLAAPRIRRLSVELTYNYGRRYGGARNFGPLAFAGITSTPNCEKLQQHGVVINRPPREGSHGICALTRYISIELLQKGEPLPPQEP